MTSGEDQVRSAPMPDTDGRPIDGDARRWQEAARLRHDHPGWVIIWLAPAAEFRACRRLRGARREPPWLLVRPSKLRSR